MQESWIVEWGLWAVLLGAVLEGEAVLIAAGYAVSQGYLPAAPVFAFAALGATLGDHLYYLVGRWWGNRIIRRSAAMRRIRARTGRILRRWGRFAAFAIRFAYGLRHVLPMSMGAARYPPLLFVPFNVLGALVFAAVYLSLGYFFGELVEEVTGRMRGASLRILVGILAAGALLWIVREWKVFRPAPPPPGEAEAGPVEGAQRGGGYDSPGEG